MNVNKSMQHFTTAFQGKILAAQKAIVSGDMKAFSDLVESVKTSGPVKSISAAVGSSQRNLTAFTEELKKLGPAGDLLIGLTSVGAGAIIYTSAAGIAVAAGVSAGLVVIVAFALIAYGIYRAVPAAWALVGAKIENLWAELQ